jgi:hypothetical protein
MSLDVYIEMPDAVEMENGTGIFIREDGQTRELTREEWDEKFPGRVPLAIIPERDRELYWANITHNLGAMADEGGFYESVWRPEEVGIETAGQLIEPLERGIADMKADPKRFEKHNSPNGWGLYENFLPWLERLLVACNEHPDATYRTSR